MKQILTIKPFFSILLLMVSILGNNRICQAQYAPAAGKTGSTALGKDSSIFINWAKKCTLQRGWINIAEKDSGLTTIGTVNSAIGKAGENGVVSLGDSGVIICEFNSPIVNGPGWDFAVFENSFEDRYLELAFVEVSSDGWRFFRFPCHSMSDTSKQTGAFGNTEPENINNLAGKYRAGYGTPFDLDELPRVKDLDLNAITHVKIIDVVGSLNPKFASYDTALRKINDPWPTPFNSSGFDLDAIGVIHQQALFVSVPNKNAEFLGPNPISNATQLQYINANKERLNVSILNAYGQILKQYYSSEPFINIEGMDLPLGMFMVKLEGKGLNLNYKGLKN